MPVTRRPRLTTRGSSGWRRPKARSWLASFAPLADGGEGVADPRLGASSPARSRPRS